MSIPIFHHPGFAAPIGQHIMPMRKFQLAADELKSDSRFVIQTPEPLIEADLQRVHTAEYIQAIRTGDPQSLAESQKFPWSPELFPSVSLTNGGIYAAANRCLTTGVAAALASGFHHSMADHGEGFCTFNGLVVSLEKLRSEGRITRAVVLDLDLHYGNGTASLAAKRPWLLAISIYGNDYFENKAYADVETLRHEDGVNHRSLALPNGGKLDTVIQSLETAWKWIEDFQPDLILYQAGADPLRDDPYSPLDLGPEDLFARDRWVFEKCQAAKIPCAWVLAGGYTPEIEKVVQVHVNTAKACAEVYRI